MHPRSLQPPGNDGIATGGELLDCVKMGDDGITTAGELELLVDCTCCTAGRELELLVDCVVMEDNETLFMYPSGCTALGFIS